MAEDNSRMDELLRSYAKKRREESGAPLELHPATRRILQDEIGRTLRATARPAAKRPLLPLIWPRLAFGAALFAIFLGLIFVFQTKVSQKPATELARLETPAPESATTLAGDLQPEAKSFSRQRERSSMDKAPGGSAAPLGLEEAEPPSVFKKEQTLADPSRYAAKSAPSQPAISGASPPEPVQTAAAPEFQADTRTTREERLAGALAKQKSVADRIDATKDYLDTTTAPAAATIAAGRPPAVQTPAAPAMSPVAAAQPIQEPDISSGTPPPSLVFVQQDAGKYRENLLSPPQPAVLKTFQFQKLGDSVRIIDADGSIYEGRLLGSVSRPSPSTTAARRSGSQKAAEVLLGSANAKIETSETFSFEVAGTNCELQQLVTLKGTFQTVMPSADLGAARLADDSARSEMKSKDSRATKAEILRPASIRGKVNVGNNTEFPLDARQSTP